MATPKTKAKAAKSKPSAASKSSGETYTDPALRDRLKAEIMAGEKGGKAGQWGARKSQLLAAEYKKAGGGYKKGKAKTEGQASLDRWTSEHWTTKDGEPAIKDGETSRYLPEGAWAELNPAQKEATDSKKRAASKRGRQFVANTPAAKAARAKAASRKTPPKS